MSEWLRETATSGSMVLALPVALFAGLVSFFSPCVIPLLPGYLSYATGLSGADLEDARRSRLVTGAVLFVLALAFLPGVEVLAAALVWLALAAAAGFWWSGSPDEAANVLMLVPLALFVRFMRLRVAARLW